MLLKPAASEPIEEGILLGGRNDFNWFRWLIEYLPRVMQIDSSIGVDVPLLVTARAPSSGMAALRRITERPVLTIDPETTQFVKTLHVVSPPVQVLDTTRIPWSEGLSFNPEPLRAMRTAWGLDALPPSTSGRRLFLSRKSDHRGVVNEARLAEIAVELGLETIEPGSMSFDDQLVAFSTATLLVGASGAVMANYLMMPPGSQVLALVSDALTDFILPAAIAAVAGVRFSYLSGPTTTTLAKSSTRNHWMHSNFSVDEDLFRAALIDALAERRATTSIRRLIRNRASSLA
ncbi:glycosyltransferase family 61 protein [Lacisediminihabitans sp.]|uniref:glycosyltransferase family 61 protein n=1 Tax=Lacisediminihabitans sp. TaxID=2787631 RepID=UPI002F94EE4F